MKADLLYGSAFLNEQLIIPLFGGYEA